MKIPHEFIQLPVSFDVERLQAEVAKLNDSDWHSHHENFKGNFAVPLISVNGGQNNAFKGKMLATQALKNSPYIQQVLGSFNEVFGRSRLMRLDGGCEVPLHSDINYYWYNRVRIHIPIVTDPKVIFHCGEQEVHMQAGDCWIFDSWKNHRVVNHSDITRVHLVIDTSGSSKFWQMVENGYTPWLASHKPTIEHIPYGEGKATLLRTENFNAPLVMNPGELDGLLNDLRKEIHLVTSNDPLIITGFEKIIHQFSKDWRQLWASFGLSEEGWPHYHQCRDRTFHQARELGSQLKITNDAPAIQMLVHCIIDPALNPEVA